MKVIMSYGTINARQFFYFCIHDVHPESAWEAGGRRSCGIITRIGTTRRMEVFRCASVR